MNAPNMAAFDRILNRKGGEPPPPGDELPESPTNETKLVCDF